MREYFSHSTQYIVFTFFEILPANVPILIFIKM